MGRRTAVLAALASLGAILLLLRGDPRAREFREREPIRARRLTVTPVASDAPVLPPASAVQGPPPAVATAPGTARGGARRPSHRRADATPPDRPRARREPAAGSRWDESLGEWNPESPLSALPLEGAREPAATRLTLGLELLERTGVVGAPVWVTCTSRPPFPAGSVAMLLVRRVEPGASFRVLKRDASPRDGARDLWLEAAHVSEALGEDGRYERARLPLSEPGRYEVKLRVLVRPEARERPRVAWLEVESEPLELEVRDVQTAIDREALAALRARRLFEAAALPCAPASELEAFAREHARSVHAVHARFERALRLGEAERATELERLLAEEPSFARRDAAAAELFQLALGRWRAAPTDGGARAVVLERLALLERVAPGSALAARARALLEAQ